MKLLLFHCSRVASKDLRRSNRPKGIESGAPAGRSFSDVLLTFVCVEPWDGEGAIEQAKSTILNHLRIIRRDHVVITPFAHLSNHLANSKQANLVIDALQKSLQTTVNLVDVLSFGFHKDFRFALSDVSVFGHPGSVAFRRIPSDAMSEIHALIGTLSIEERNSLINSLRPTLGNRATTTSRTPDH